MKFILVTLMLSLNGYAAEKPVPSAKASKTEAAAPVATGTEISVKGMVCSFCAQGIEKKLKALKEVRSMEVDLDTKKVNVQFVPGQSVSSEKLSEIIKGAGYEVTEVKVRGLQQ